MVNYYFLVIKGTGMSALAQILHDSAVVVHGSEVDKRFSTQTELEEKEIPILPFSSDNIKEDQIVIAGNAFTENNIEIKQALEMGVTFYKYHEFLGKWIER